MLLMKKPTNPKERNLIKGAIRRVFSRSELRRSALNNSVVKGYHDDTRPRVTKWGRCSICNNLEPAYKLEIDHINPVQPIGVLLEEMTWDELVNRIWCNEAELQPVCKECHRIKSKQENKERRLLKKGKNK